MQSVASQNAPSPKILIPHFVFGGFTWLIATILIIFSPDAFVQHYFNPKLLSITHLLVLGWITMIIFGALYQLIPVILEVKLYSERLAFISFIFLASGAVSLSVSFWNFWIGTPIYFSATLVIIAVILFALNIFLTANKSKKENIEKDFILTAVSWLLFTVGAGLTLAINLTHPFLSPPITELLKLHAHAGIVGWVLQLTIGVSSHLLPMFMVSHNLNKKKLNFAYYFINVGLIIGIVFLFVQWQPGVMIGVLSVVAGIICFLSFQFEAYKKRVRKQLDIGMKQSALSFIFLIVALILVLVLTIGFKKIIFITLPMAIAYGSLLLLGFISSLIMGQTYKTLPFIIWLKVYRNRVGKGKIPFPKNLYSEQMANLQLCLFATGIITLLSGIIIKYTSVVSAGGIILFCSVLLYNLNILKIIFHKPAF
ncbi:MAG: hypothetical protein ABIZ51_04800 [Bacteroidia bacterium]